MSEKKPGQLPTAVEAKWADAAAHPGEDISMGDIVVCDYCGRDWRGRTESGGLIFQSKAICPLCAPEAEKGIRQFGEERYVRARCREGVSFWHFVLDYRQRTGSTFIRVTTGEDAMQLMRSTVEQPIPPPAPESTTGIDAEFMASTEHSYGCRCNGCLTWWAKMGDDEGDYGPFTRAEVNERQRQLGLSETL
jgi:hypothetical protein